MINALHQAAKTYLDAGLSVAVASKASGKRPIHGWKQHRDTPMTSAEVQHQLGRGGDMLGLITGYNHVEVVDIDAVIVGKRFAQKVNEDMPGFLDRLTVEWSPSGGAHILYRVPGMAVPGNIKLAFKREAVSGPGFYVLNHDGTTTEVEQGASHAIEAVRDGDEWACYFCALETRGTGGFLVCYPTPGYRLVRGDIAALPEITIEEREQFHAIARSFNEKRTETANGNPQKEYQPDPLDTRPGTKFNNEATPETTLALLCQHGWELANVDAEHYFVSRPGKSAKDGHSATIRRDNGVFYVFSSNVPDFEPDKGYQAFEVHTRLNHEGNHSSAAKVLLTSEPPAQTTRTPSKGVSAAELMRMEIPPTRWAVHDFMPEGLSMLAGSPKLGKSWMALQLCVDVATGGEFMGEFICQEGEAVYLALEDGRKRLQGRLQRVLGRTPAPDGLTLHTDWPAFDGGGLEALASMLEERKEIRLVVIDTWSKVRPLKKPRGASAYEIDYAEAGKLKKLADKYHVAILLIHHLRKTDPRSNGGDPVESINGSSGISGAMDTIFVLARARNTSDAELHCTGRDVEERTLALKKDEATQTWCCHGSAVPLANSPEQQRVLEYLRVIGASSPKDVAEGLKLDANYVRKACRKLVEQGLLTKPNYGVYAVVDLFESVSHTTPKNTGYTEDT